MSNGVGKIRLGCVEIFTLARSASLSFLDREYDSSKVRGGTGCGVAFGVGARGLLVRYGDVGGGIEGVSVG